jgi:hypothetical protein
MASASGYKGLDVLTPFPTESGGQILNTNFQTLADRSGPTTTQDVFPIDGNDVEDSLGAGVVVYDRSTWEVYEATPPKSGTKSYGYAVCLDNTDDNAVWFYHSGGYLCKPSGLDQFDNLDISFIGKNQTSYAHGQLVLGTEQIPQQPYVPDDQRRGSMKRTLMSLVGETNGAVEGRLQIHDSDNWNNGRDYSYKNQWRVDPSGYSNVTIYHNLKVIASRTDCAQSDMEAAAWNIQWVMKTAATGITVSIASVPAAVGGFIDANAGDDTGGTWKVGLLLDTDANLQIRLVGEANKKVYWHGELQTIEVGAVYTSASSGAGY